MIYVSTGGFRDRTADEVANELLGLGINAIELSGGAYSPDLLDCLQSMKSDVQFQIHNYFPPPAVPFVLNMGSQDPDIAARSIAHVEKALNWCISLGANRYSFHAGFLIDPKVEELGKRISNRDLFIRKDCIEAFVERVTYVASIARKKGIALMIENNVLSKRNAQEFPDNPLLMCEPEECRNIMRQMPENVGMLVDVAHLKVSAKTMGFNPIDMFEMCDEWINGYHLSDNDGMSDSNQAINEDAWFWPYLKPSVDYYTIEVYNNTAQQLLGQVKLMASKLDSNIY